MFKLKEKREAKRAKKEREQKLLELRNSNLIQQLINWYNEWKDKSIEEINYAELGCEGYKKVYAIYTLHPIIKSIISNATFEISPLSRSQHCFYITDEGCWSKVSLEEMNDCYEEYCEYDEKDGSNYYAYMYDSHACIMQNYWKNMIKELFDFIAA